MKNTKRIIKEAKNIILDQAVDVEIRKRLDCEVKLLVVAKSKTRERLAIKVQIMLIKYKMLVRYEKKGKSTPEKSILHTNKDVDIIPHFFVACAVIAGFITAIVYYVIGSFSAYSQNFMRFDGYKGWTTITATTSPNSIYLVIWLLVFVFLCFQAYKPYNYIAKKRGWPIL